MTEPANNAEQRVFSDVRTARATANGEGYTVAVDRFAVPADRDNVHWLNEPDAGLLPARLTAHGVLLTRYQVTKDSDPSWFAEIEIDRPATPGGQLRVVSVRIDAHDLPKTTLPISALLSACVRVGGVVGVYQDVQGELSGRTIRTFRLGPPERNQDGLLFSPDDAHLLTGERPPQPRGYRQDRDLLQRVYQAAQEHEREKQRRIADDLPVRGSDFPTLYAYVSQRCGLPESNVKKQIKAAREMYGSTSEGETK